MLAQGQLAGGDRRRKIGGPIRYRSTEAAADRPSAMAHTMRLWPRVMSPHTNTPSTLVDHDASAATLPRGSTSSPSSATRPVRSDPRNPMASSTSSQGSSNSRTLDRDERRPAVLAEHHLDLFAPQSPDVPSSSARNSVGGDREEPLATLLERRRRPQDERPGRPRVVAGPVGRGLGHDLELVDAEGPLPVGGAQAVGAGVPPPMITTCLPSAVIGDAASAPSWTRLEGFR